MITNNRHLIFKITYFLFVFFILNTLSACDDSPTPIPNKQQQTDKKPPEQKPDLTEDISLKAKIDEAEPQYRLKSKYGWNTIKRTGILRIIVPFTFQLNEFLLRESLPYNDELKLIVRFAEDHDLEPVFISTKDFSKMFSLLNDGFGDIIVANLTILESRKKKVNFTIPVDYSVEQLVVAQSNLGNIDINHMNGLKIGVRENTSFWETITSLKKELQADIKNIQEFDIIKLDDKVTPDDKFNQIVYGNIDAVVIDSNRLKLFKEYRKDVKAAIDLTKEKPIAWAVRKNNPELLKQLNSYIKTEKLLRDLPDTRVGDLDEIKKYRHLRLITRNNSSTYFIWKNKLMGFEYDLIKHFAKQQKINLKVLVAQDSKQMIQWLDEGYGDIISAGLIKTPDREKLAISFTDPYLYVKEVIVQRKDEEPINSIRALEQRTFYVRKSSSYWNTLSVLQKELSKDNIPFNIELVRESMETEAIIKNVIDGQFDLTLADSHIIDIEKSWHSNLQASLSLTDYQAHRWLIRDNNKQLLAELNKFIKNEYKKLFYNITYNKYFKNSRNLFDADKLLKNNKDISPYDDLIRSLASEYNFDWRLIAAQVNTESQFNPRAKSWAGAIGLLQVMPRTAREVGISDLEKPENGLRAGVKYMDWLRKQLSNELPDAVRTWFILAAYNAGLGHLKDARSLAAKQGLNPNRWFGHVEQAFILLSRPEYYKKARYGYVRGIEPVTYIKRIQALFELYSNKHPEEA
ncbi:MAG: transporter substrate-binding domain-containing protein [gamma proteobacterium symbiont of Bathyaustriella thionipta]|nr:transporter substrate-binding domain-containing protein [gamma proteobacterium symbiont of Bathyaustriella thionipta]MCU7957117.1 transporter substrate-binding domain-containing protein [gamma proteobacterium symbiont of Bathyaustriella thionipta]